MLQVAIKDSWIQVCTLEVMPQSPKNMFSYFWSSTNSDETIIHNASDTDNIDTPMSTPPPNILTPQLWCVCVWEDYVDPCDCCGRGSRDQAKLKFTPKDGQKKVNVIATPYTIGKWMDEDDFFDFDRDDTVNFCS